MAIDISKEATYEVEVGDSILRPSGSGDNIPHFSLRYSFKPESLDYTRTSAIQQSGGEVTLSVPLTGVDGEYCEFQGKTEQTPETNCVIVFDHRTRKAYLERVGVNVRLSVNRNANSHSRIARRSLVDFPPRRMASPLPAAASSPALYADIKEEESQEDLKVMSAPVSPDSKRVTQAGSLGSGRKRRRTQRKIESSESEVSDASEPDEGVVSSAKLKEHLEKVKPEIPRLPPSLRDLGKRKIVSAASFKSALSEPDEEI